MPTGGQWTPLKNEATDFVHGTGGPEVNTTNLVTDFIRATGGFKGLRRGHGGSAPSGSRGSASGRSGKGGGGGGGSAAIGTARNLGSFLSRVGEVGLETALREKGLEEYIGKSAAEISDALLDEFAGPASTLDNAVAREALAELRDELLDDAATFADVEQRLEAKLNELGLFGILASFFGHYVFRLFCRNFYEDWLKKAGNSKTASKLNEIRDYITSSLRTRLAGRKLGSTNWKGKEGTQIVIGVLKETVEVFGVTG
jgi:hypothetical protein